MINSEVKKYIYCSNCGEKLIQGFKFCNNCGTKVGSIKADEADNLFEESSINEAEDKINRKEETERKTVYEGILHKCPSCGQVLESFTTKCPLCGHEIRDTKSSVSIRNLAYKLEKIESRQMPIVGENKSIMKMVFGRDLNKEDEDEARAIFEKQKNQEKAELIINYAVPNTKEDILEFIILASSNIEPKKTKSDVVTKAWLKKLEQVYQRAELTMSNISEFAQIKNIYDKKKCQIKNEKLKGALMIIGPIVGYFVLMGLLWNPMATISIVIFLVLVILVSHILFKKR